MENTFDKPTQKGRFIELRTLLGWEKCWMRVPEIQSRAIGVAEDEWREHPTHDARSLSLLGSVLRGGDINGRPMKAVQENGQTIISLVCIGREESTLERCTATGQRLTSGSRPRPASDRYS